MTTKRILPSKQPQHIFEVSELNQKIKQLLEENFPFLWISGEISNFRRPSSGHCYFTLKDPKSQIGCVIFRTQADTLKFNLEDGISVIGLGRVAVYEPRGAYQVIFEYLDPKGIGGLQLEFEKRKKKLFNEGLFDDFHKQPLPFLPRKISIVTSSSGAAVRDFIKVAHRRFPNMAMEIVDVSVQGDHSATDIIRALNQLNDSANTDLIVLTRGGGSIEDLSAFNDEGVARAIFASNLPVVSAVGHETDFTIADFVADLRAPTPSAAAEVTVPLKKEFQHRIQLYEGKLEQSIDTYLKLNKKHLESLANRIVHPKRRMQDMRIRLDDLLIRHSTTFKSILARKEEQVRHNHTMLTSLSVDKNIQLLKRQLAGNNCLLIERMENRLKNGQTIVQNYQTTLGALNPMAILKRGYSITRTLPDHSIIKNAQTVDIDQSIEILLGNGELSARVTGKRDSSSTT